MKSILCSIENSSFVSDPQNTAINSEKVSSGASTEHPSPVSKAVFAWNDDIFFSRAIRLKTMTSEMLEAHGAHVELINIDVAWL